MKNSKITFGRITAPSSLHSETWLAAVMLLVSFAASAIVSYADQPAVQSGTSGQFESYDGTNNNVKNPAWGSAGSNLLRLAPVGYSDGIDSPALPDDRSARAISNLLNNQAVPGAASEDVQTVDQNSLSDFGYAFGQFMDHDMDNTPDGGASFPIPVAPDDPIGPDALTFTRARTDPSTGTSVSSPAQQVSVVTSYLDLSQVYGSSAKIANALRKFTGGLLKTSPGSMLPYAAAAYFTADQITALDMANDARAVPEDQLFAAGDVRANENVELTALQTLFLRNHNAVAAQLQKEHPAWTDEQLYQESRKLNIADYQAIVYNEWIPAMLGSNALPEYTGYDPAVNATISTEFSTVAYRFGHSLVSPSIAREGNDGQAITDNIPLSLDFFDPNLLNPIGAVDPLTGLVSTDIGPILKADADGNGQQMDLLAINEIRNLLFGNGGLGGDDLMARDVQRGRDDGIPDYNTVRTALGLPKVTTFGQITGNARLQDAADVAMQQELAQAYPGGVDTIDAFEGGLAEHAVPGSDVGPTFQAIIVDQFRRLRSGDRFFYLNESFNSDEVRIFRQADTLAKMIMANSTARNLQADVMTFRASISGTVTSAGIGKTPVGRDGTPGITVELQDTSGNVLAITKTDPQGRFEFNQLSGPAAPGSTPGVSATGFYNVAVITNQAAAQIATPKPIEITTGDSVNQNVNLSLSGGSPPPPHRRASKSAAQAARSTSNVPTPRGIRY